MSTNAFDTGVALTAGVACIVAVAAGGVLCWRWLRPNGQLEPRRYVVATCTLVVLFSVLAVVAIFESAWPTVGLSTVLAAAFSAAVRRMRRRHQDSTEPETAP